MYLINMQLSHWERNQRKTDGIFWVLNNLEKTNKYFYKFSLNCQYYSKLKEVRTWLNKVVNDNQKVINTIWELIDYINSKEGHYTDNKIADELINEVWEAVKNTVLKGRKDGHKLIKMVNEMETIIAVKKEVLSSGNYKRYGKYDPIRKAKSIYEIFPLTEEVCSMVNPPKY